jgi:hypothetical protein
VCRGSLKNLHSFLYFSHRNLFFPQVLELAGKASGDNMRIRIVPRHILLAVRNDEELDRFMRKCIIASGGVVPNIHMALLPKKLLPHNPADGAAPDDGQQAW